MQHRTPPEASGWAARFVPPPGSRVAVVGGCGGVGRRVVDAATDLGHRVAVLDLPQSLQAHPPNVEHAIALDATDPAQIENAMAQLDAAWGALDVLFFLVGFTFAPPRNLMDVDGLAFDDILRGNLISAHLTFRAGVPLLRKGNAPTIVATSTGLALNVGRGFGPYGAAKAGLIALIKVLALELAPQIRVNCVAPSAMQTDFMRGGLSREVDLNIFDPAPYIATIPLGRICEVDDVVAPMMFLASPGAAFINGQTLHINGARYMP